MKRYAGYTDGLQSASGAVVLVYEETPRRVARLPHYEHHAPTGFAWGYYGSGPADLARCLLRDVLGYFPPATCYQAFKEDVVAQWPADRAWALSEAGVTAWLQDHPPQCLWCGGAWPALSHPYDVPDCPGCRAGRALRPGPVARVTGVGEMHACAACVGRYGLAATERVLCPG